VSYNFFNFFLKASNANEKTTKGSKLKGTKGKSKDSESEPVNLNLINFSH
jgi:hypothetical protein